MRYLLCSLGIVLMGCVSYPKKNGFIPVIAIKKELVNPYFSSESKDYVYKSRIDALGKAFGGILIIKKLGKADHRIVFTTELGNTIFDFSISGETFKVNRILTEMDKKILINILKKDFMALVKEAPTIANGYLRDKDYILGTKIWANQHYYIFNDGVLQKIIRTGSGKEKVVFIFSGINDNIAEHIEITHLNIPLKIALDSF